MPNEEDRRELVRKITAYVGTTYGGTDSDAWRRGFTATDRDGDGRISRRELRTMLSNAGVGSFLTVDAWTQGVMRELDKDLDGKLSLDELMRVLVAQAQPANVTAPPRPAEEPFRADATIRNPVVKQMNRAIMRLCAGRLRNPAVAGLYKRWVRFLQSAKYQTYSDTLLWPTYRAFAATYASLCRSLNVAPDEVDPDLVALAGADAAMVFEDAGPMLDRTLDALYAGAEKLGRSAAMAVLPLALIAIAVFLAFNHRSGGRGQN